MQTVILIQYYEERIINMAIRNIVKDGDPILEKECRIVEKFDKKLGTLLDDMYETMVDANGVGLAAPQVGIMRQLCIIEVDPDEGVIELINPTIIKSDGTQLGSEGCLSYPGEYALVERPMYVTVRAQDRNGEWFEKDAEGLCARAFCHEIDHLHGIIYKTRAIRMLSDEELETGEIPELMDKNEK